MSNSQTYGHNRLEDMHNCLLVVVVVVALSPSSKTLSKARVGPDHDFALLTCVPRRRLRVGTTSSQLYFVIFTAIDELPASRCIFRQLQLNPPREASSSTTTPGNTQIGTRTIQQYLVSIEFGQSPVMNNKDICTSG